MNATSRLFVVVIALVACSPPPSVEEPAREPAHLSTYARAVHGAFDADRAHRTVAHVDRFFRVRGNEGYQQSLERVRSELQDGGIEARTLELGPVVATWTPRSATLALGDDPIVQFADETGRDRACLLVRSDAMPETELELVRAGESNVRGRVALVEGDPREAFALFVTQSGAAGIVVKNLALYHRDPDAAQFGYLPQHEGRAFGFSVSQRMWDRLIAATDHGPARIRVAIDVATGQSAATAIEARIAGTDPRAGPIVFVAHVDEPGANDNASGVAAQAELARALARLIESGALPRPRRTLVFLWGQEIEVSRRWLEANPASAALVMDMVGADPNVVGAPFLLERMPDPGAVWLRAPDAHTEWGSSEISERDLHGHFLNDLVVASASAVDAIDPFAWRSHPFEGGSDHVPFLDRGTPAVLAWHFTDDAYHTNLDRLDRVSGAEMRRAAAVIGASALLMASGDEEDALELVAILERAARDRRASLERASHALIARGDSDHATERHVRAAWTRFEDEALDSIATWSPSPRVRARIDRARGRMLR